jgi:hypothetical protein
MARVGTFSQGSFNWGFVVVIIAWLLIFPVKFFN